MKPDGVLPMLLAGRWRLVWPAETAVPVPVHASHQLLAWLAAKATMHAWPSPQGAARIWSFIRSEKALVSNDATGPIGKIGFSNCLCPKQGA